LTPIASDPLKGLDEGKWNLFYQLRYESSSVRSFLGRICNMPIKKGFHPWKWRDFHNWHWHSPGAEKRPRRTWIRDRIQSIFLEKIGFISGKDKEEMGESFLGSKKKC